MYAVVQRVMGGDNARVICQDGAERVCIIRAKFRGRRRHQNLLTQGSWVLVGLRLWEHSSKQKCDLLYVYSAEEVTRLKKLEQQDQLGINSPHLQRAWRASSCAGGEDETIDNGDVECLFDETAGDSIITQPLDIESGEQEDHFGMGDAEIDLDEI